MGKRLTPEEKARRLQEYEEAKAKRRAERLKRREARIEAWKNRQSTRRTARPKAPEIRESGKVGMVLMLPTYEGEIRIGDTLGFRWLGMFYTGVFDSVTEDVEYKRKTPVGVESESEEEEIFPESVDSLGTMTKFFWIRSDETYYPIR